jgi:hypothetical protein
MDQSEYVPWPKEGCGLHSAVGRLGAGNLSDLEKIKSSCHQYLLRGELVAYGRLVNQDGGLAPISPAAWKNLAIDWHRGKVFKDTGIEIDHVVIFPPLIAPCRNEFLNGLPIVDAFRNFVLKDPEVVALAAVALPLAPKWKPFFGHRQSMYSAASEWPVNVDRWEFLKPVHPDRAKQSVFERHDDADRIETVIAVEALKHRYRSLLSVLQAGLMSARGIPAREGYSEQIMRSVWSHEAFYLQVETGDLLQDNERSEGRYDRFLKSWIGVVLGKPAPVISEDGRVPTNLFHVNNTDFDESPLTAMENNSTARRRPEGRTDTVTTSYRGCVTWLAGLMRESPNVRKATIDELWRKARRQWPNTLSHRSFIAARNEAIRTSGASAWAAAGRSKKSSQEESAR